MTLALEIPEELAPKLGTEATRLSREALGVAALRQGLWKEAELGRFLMLSRLELDQVRKDHAVDVTYTWDDLERERELHRQLARS